MSTSINSSTSTIIWRFPEMGVPLNHPFLSWTFHCKSNISVDLPFNDDISNNMWIQYRYPTIAYCPFPIFHNFIYIYESFYRGFLKYGYPQFILFSIGFSLIHHPFWLHLRSACRSRLLSKQQRLQHRRRAGAGEVHPSWCRGEKRGMGAT